MNTSEAGAAQTSGVPDETLSYAYRPAPMGASWEFRLAPDALEWDIGRRSGRVPYGEIRRLRLSFRPVTVQTYRFLAEIWPAAGPKLQVASTSWKSMFEQERLDEPYSAFLAALHRRLAAARSNARFDTGSPPLLYWPGLAVFVGAGLALAGLVVRALQVEAWSAAALIVGVFVLMLWQVGTFFRRNRPGTYRPEEIPADSLPG